jgi:hypothetical protein
MSVHNEGDGLTLCAVTFTRLSALGVVLPSKCCFGDVSAILWIWWLHDFPHPLWELMKVVGSYGMLSLLFAMEVMV